MKVCSVGDQVVFEVELTTQRPDLGPLAFKRKDRDEYIAIQEVFGLPGTSAPQYHIIEVNPEEQALLAEGGMMIVERPDQSFRQT